MLHPADLAAKVVARKGAWFWATPSEEAILCESRAVRGLGRSVSHRIL